MPALLEDSCTTGGEEIEGEKEEIEEKMHCTLQQ